MHSIEEIQRSSSWLALAVQLREKPQLSQSAQYLSSEFDNSKKKGGNLNIKGEDQQEGNAVVEGDGKANVADAIPILQAEILFCSSLRDLFFYL